MGRLGLAPLDAGAVPGPHVPALRCARLNLSARAYHRVLKIARTVADLAGDSRIGVSHVAEAIQYRRLDSHSR